MTEDKFEFRYKVYNDSNELPENLRDLIVEARKVTEQAYAPYSNFKVGAIAKLVNGETVTGTNQENASFPVGLCAERVLLSAVTSSFPGIAIETIAISYNGDNHENDYPVAPCGLCRQTLLEYESRLNHPIRLVLGGMKGQVFELDSVSNLLPLAFSSKELG